MTTEKMKELLSAKDEKITIEYKSCTNEISDTVYETVSSFSNRYGGWIIMGVQDGGIPIGVNRNAAKDMKGNYCYGLTFRRHLRLLDVREECTIEMMRAILILRNRRFRWKICMHERQGLFQKISCFRMLQKMIFEWILCRESED